MLFIRILTVDVLCSSLSTGRDFKQSTMAFDDVMDSQFICFARDLDCNLNTFDLFW